MGGEPNWSLPGVKIGTESSRKFITSWEPTYNSPMHTQEHPKSEPSQEQAAEHVAAAHQLLKALQEKVGEHPEIGQAVNKLEMALAILGVRTGGML